MISTHRYYIYETLGEVGNIRNNALDLEVQRWEMDICTTTLFFFLSIETADIDGNIIMFH